MSERQVIWDVTGRCNLLCNHCYAYDKYEWRNKNGPNRTDMPLDECKKTLSKIKDMGFHLVNMLGGEPLIRRDLVDIVEFARKLNIQVTITTNGLLLNEGLIERFIDLEVKQIAISFEGTTASSHDLIRGNGTFEKARKNLAFLCERVMERGADILIGPSFTITRSGLDDVKNYFLFALDNSCNGLNIGIVTEEGRAVEFFDELECSEEDIVDELENMMQTVSDRMPRDFTLQMNVKPKLRRYLSERYGIPVLGEPFGDLCPAGDGSILVENDGVTTPCGLLNKKSKNERAVMEGQYTPELITIHDFESWEEMKESRFFESFDDFKKRHHGTVEGCRECEFLNICQPCPVDFLDSMVVEECVVSEDRRRQWRGSIWKKPLKLRMDLQGLPGQNETSHNIIAQLERGCSLADISQDILSRSDAPPETVESDIWKFVMDLRVAGVLDIPDVTSKTKV